MHVGTPHRKTLNIVVLLRSSCRLDTWTPYHFLLGKLGPPAPLGVPKFQSLRSWWFRVSDYIIHQFPWRTIIIDLLDHNICIEIASHDSYNYECPCKVLQSLMVGSLSEIPSW